MREKRKNEPKVKCTLCNDFFFEHQMHNVYILTGCCDCSEGLICNDCFKDPPCLIRRLR